MSSILCVGTEANERPSGQRLCCSQTVEEYRSDDAEKPSAAHVVSGRATE